MVVTILCKDNTNKINICSFSFFLYTFFYNEPLYGKKKNNVHYFQIHCGPLGAVMVANH